MEHQILFCNESSPCPSPTAPTRRSTKMAMSDTGGSSCDGYGSPATPSDSSGYDSLHSIDDDSEEPCPSSSFSPPRKTKRLTEQTTDYLSNSSSSISSLFSWNYGVEQQTQVNEIQPMPQRIYQTKNRPSSPATINGQLDQHWLDDNERILEKMLTIEHLYVPWNVDKEVYCSRLYQTNANIRRQLTEWMYEVCEDSKSKEDVFTLSVNFLDRIMLVMSKLPKSQLQLVAIVCLLVASKLRQCTPFDLNYLSYTSDFTFSVRDILIWEQVILKHLEWDLGAVIATDYLDYILVIFNRLLQEHEQQQSFSIQHNHKHHYHSYYHQKLSHQNQQTDEMDHEQNKNCRMVHKRPLPFVDGSSSSYHHKNHHSNTSNKRIKHNHHIDGDDEYSNYHQSFPASTNNSNNSTLRTPSIEALIRKHTNTYISICSLELSFVCVKPSVIASACVATAIRGIINSMTKEHHSSNKDNLKNQLQSSAYYLYRRFLSLIQEKLNIDSKILESYVELIERLTASKLENGNDGVYGETKSHVQQTGDNVDLGMIPANNGVECSSSAFTSKKSSSSTTSTALHEQQQEALATLNQQNRMWPMTTMNQQHQSFFKLNSTNHSLHSNTTTTVTLPTPAQQQQNSNYIHTTFAQVATAKQLLLSLQNSSNPNNPLANIPSRISDNVSNNQEKQSSLTDLLDYLEQEDRENIPLFIIDPPTSSTPLQSVNRVDNQENIAPLESSSNLTGGDDLDDIIDPDEEFDLDHLCF